MSNCRITFRQAGPADADTVAEIARKSCTHFLPYLPNLHSIEEDKRFYRNSVFGECSVWVAEFDNNIVGFCAFKEGWVDHLYFLPKYVGRSLGATLLNKAKASHRSLQVWIFQRNTRAIRFYVRNGFMKVMETDGSANEEKMPDALYDWRMRPESRFESDDR